MHPVGIAVFTVLGIMWGYWAVPVIVRWYHRRQADKAIQERLDQLIRW